ncbi:MAG: hypothetical protein WKG07_25835 [Hymenobacter sp.]
MLSLERRHRRGHRNHSGGGQEAGLRRGPGDARPASRTPRRPRLPSHIWYRDLEDYIAAQYIASTEAEYEAILNSSPTASYRYAAARDWQLPAPKVGVERGCAAGRRLAPLPALKPWLAPTRPSWTAAGPARDKRGRPGRDPHAAAGGWTTWTW